MWQPPPATAIESLLRRSLRAAPAQLKRPRQLARCPTRIWRAPRSAPQPVRLMCTQLRRCGLPARLEQGRQPKQELLQETLTGRAQHASLAYSQPRRGFCSHRAPGEWQQDRPGLERRFNTSKRLMGRLQQSSSVDDLLTIHDARAPLFNHVHIGVCWGLLGKFAAAQTPSPMPSRPSSLLFLCEHTTSLLREANEQSLCTTARGAAMTFAALTASAHAPTLDARLPGSASEPASTPASGPVPPPAPAPTPLLAVCETDTRTAADAAAAAAAAEPLSQLLDDLSAEASARLEDLSPRALSTVTWALSRAGRADAALLEAVATHATAKADGFNSTDVATITWAFAAADHPAAELFHALADSARLSVADSSAQSLANTAWAYARAGYAPSALFDAVAAEACRRIGEFKPLEVSSLAWAFASAGVDAPQLFAAIEADGARRASEFTPQSLANTVWAFAKSEMSAASLFAAVADVAAPQLRAFKPQELANLAWAFGHAGVSAPPLFSAVAAEASGRIDAFKPEELTMLALGFVWAAQPFGDLFQALAQRCHDSLEEFSGWTLASLAWIFAAIDQPCAILDSDAFGERCRAQELQSFELVMLHQFVLWCEERGVQHTLGDELAAACRDAFTADATLGSRSQAQVAAALEAMGCRTQQEVRVSSGYSIDIVADWCGAPVLIEYDGITHFVGGTRTPTGSTSLKRRQLHRLGGATLLSIPYWEWDGLNHPERRTCPELRADYLCRILSDTLYWARLRDEEERHSLP